MKMTRIKQAANERARKPYEFTKLASYFCDAVRGYADRNVRFLPSDTTYAVLQEESSVFLISCFLLGFLRHAKSEAVWVEEDKRRIRLMVKGKMHRKEGIPSPSALYPKEPSLENAFQKALTENDAFYTVEPEGDTLLATLSFRRFLAKEFVAAAFTMEDVGNGFYRTMLLLGGQTAKAPLSKEIMHYPDSI